MLWLTNCLAPYKKEAIVKKSTWVVVCIVAAVAMAAVALVSTFMGGCDSFVKLENGSNMPMKCHWTFVADTYIGIIGVVIALMGATCKDQSGRRATGVGLIAVALMAACMPASFGIGLCADAAMHCHETATAVWVLCAVAAIVGIVQIVKSRPAVDEGPRRPAGR